jgi:AraC-like DNA-binding protein
MANRTSPIRSSGKQPAEMGRLDPSVAFFQLSENAILPPQWKNENNFTITRLQSTFGLANRIMKCSTVKALLVSVSLRSIPLGLYELWANAKQLPTSYVPSFRTNVIDFDSGPGCWAGSCFDYVHYHVPRETLDDIADDWSIGAVWEFRQSVLEDDLVLAQMTKNIIPSITANVKPCSLVLDHFQLILGAHLLQRYGGLIKEAPVIGGLAFWQKRRALELLRENLDGGIRLNRLAQECGLSVSHFARSFKSAFGVSTHQWLTQRRVERAKELLSLTFVPLVEVAAESGFGDQAAFTRTFHRVVGASPGRWRREHQSKGGLKN